MSTPNPDALVARVRKLLALAGSPNEHEAAAAAEKAHRLMAEHGIAAAQLAVEDDGLPIAGRYDVRGRRAPWSRLLADAVARSIGGRVLIATIPGDRRSCHFLFYAPAGAEAAESAAALYEYLAEALAVQSKVAAAARSEFDRMVSPTRTWRTSWLVGAAMSLAERLLLRKAEVESENPYALVVSGAAVDALVDEQHGKVRKGRSQLTANDPYAHMQGDRAGASMPLGDAEVAGRRRELTP